MNKRLIVYILGWVLIIEGACMQLSTIVGICYQEWADLKYFIIIGLVMIALGVLAGHQKAQEQRHVSQGRLCGDGVLMDAAVGRGLFAALDVANHPAFCRRGL